MRGNNTVCFPRPLTYSRDYPSPAFTVRPIHNQPGNESERFAPQGTHKTFHAARARYSLAVIALANLRPGDTVLLPAYHCPAMVEPFLWAGCRVTFYPVTGSLAPVASEFQERLKAAQAVVFTRYFGFEQVTEHLVAMARNHRCLVIEDLAHAAFIPRLHGDVGVTSLPKFFPQEAGSEIWCADQILADRLNQVIASQQLSRPLWALMSIHRKVKRKIEIKLGVRKRRQASYRHFDEFELKRPSSLCTIRAAKKQPHVPETHRHRTHYQQLLEIASRSPLGIALYPELSADVVPYVFPFLLHDAESFHLIRNAGIPLYRWEELAPTDCEVSASYRSRLIQIPCHQDMRTEDFVLIDSCLADTLT